GERKAEARLDCGALSKRDRRDVRVLEEPGGEDGMNEFKGQTLSWQIVNGAIELALHRDPCNEIGSLTLEELERFTAELPELANEASALIVHSTLKAGFSAGADLRELFQRA